MPDPVISGGRQVLYAEGVPLVVRCYSDSLLVTLLKAERPNRYKDRVASEVNTEVTLNGGIPALRARARASAEDKRAVPQAGPVALRMTRHW